MAGISLLIFTNTIMINNTTNVVNGQGQIKQENFTEAASNLTDVNNIPIRKVRSGDIDVSYMMFGKGDSLLLISGSGNVMDLWPHPFLHELSKNHKVIIFDNRGVGNTTSGSNPFSITQFAKDTAGLLNMLKV